MKKRATNGGTSRAFYEAHKHEISEGKYQRLVKILQGFVKGSAVVWESADGISAQCGDTGAFHDEERGAVRRITLRRAWGCGSDSSLHAPGEVFKRTGAPDVLKKIDMTRLCNLSKTSGKTHSGGSSRRSAWLLESPMGMEGLWELTMEEFER